MKLSENNSKSINVFLNDFSDTVFAKVSHCKYAKEIWDKLRNIYEGDTKVKAAKIQTVGRLVVVIDVNPSHGFWTRRLMKLFGHEGK